MFLKYMVAWHCYLGVLDPGRGHCILYWGVTVSYIGGSLDPGGGHWILGLIDPGGQWFLGCSDRGSINPRTEWPGGHSIGGPLKPTTTGLGLSNMDSLYSISMERWQPNPRLLSLQLRELKVKTLHNCNGSQRTVMLTTYLSPSGIPKQPLHIICIP